MRPRGLSTVGIGTGFAAPSGISRCSFQPTIPPRLESRRSRPPTLIHPLCPRQALSTHAQQGQVWCCARILRVEISIPFRCTPPGQALSTATQAGAVFSRGDSLCPPELCRIRFVLPARLPCASSAQRHFQASQHPARCVPSGCRLALFAVPCTLRPARPAARISHPARCCSPARFGVCGRSFRWPLLHAASPAGALPPVSLGGHGAGWGSLAGGSGSLRLALCAGCRGLGSRSVR